VTDEPKETKRAVRVTDKRIDAGNTDAVTPVDEASIPVELDLQVQLDSARAEAAQHLDDLKRLKAEFENYRKRMIKEQTSMIERASVAVVERLLPILDNFELALLAADRTKDFASMVRGVEMVYGELVELLRKEGLERIDALGKAFDPEMHEAVLRSEGEGDEIVVLEEMRPGYAIAGRVVRPAMVKVGPKAGQEAGDGHSEGHSEGDGEGS
jgi:molecular chaperone GrpE